MKAYAQRTKIAGYTTQVQIVKLLKGAGATRVGTLDEGHSTVIVFEVNSIPYKIQLATAEKCDQRELDRLWRCLFMVTKAKLVAVAEGIETFDHVFLAHAVVDPQTGATVGDVIIPQLKAGTAKALLVRNK